VLWLLVVLVVGPDSMAGAGAGGACQSGPRSSWLALGPWPVDPRHITSRGELIQAFEYLACLLLGPDALHRNHVDLAGQIAALHPTPTRQAAARSGTAV